MKYFICSMKDKTGRTHFRIQKALNKRACIAHERPAKAYLTGVAPYDLRRLKNKKVSLETLLMFTHRLSSLIEAGISILKAMQILWKQTEDKSMQLIISVIHQSIEEGQHISLAFKEYPRIFSPLYCALIAVAEKTGNLSAILKKLTKYLEYQKQFITRIKKATIYPAVVMSLAIAVLVGMFAGVVPVFQKVLMKMRVELPLPTRIIIAISELINSWYFLPCLLMAGCAVYFAFRVLRRSERFSHILDQGVIRIPFIGNILYTIAISRFVQTLSMLMGSGLPIVASFDVAKTTFSNQVIFEGINKVQKQIEDGGSLYQSFSAVDIFPVMLIEMVGVGEATGTIVKVLENLAVHFDDEVDYQLNKILTLLEPALIIFVGGVVILTLLAIYMPVFSLWDSLTG